MRRIELQSLLPSGDAAGSRLEVLQRVADTVAKDDTPTVHMELVRQVVDSTLPGEGSRVGGNETAAPSTGSADPRAGGQSGLSTLLDGPAKDIGEQLSALTAQVANLKSSQDAQTSATQGNTQAVTQNTTARSGSGQSVGNVVGNIASNFLGSAFSLSPLISGLMSLFGGGSQQTSVAPTRFALPEPVEYHAGITGGSTTQVAPVDYGQSGQPRIQQAPAAPQVNIQVSAMDSQSFLDHRDEIARAVREAILSSNSLNDVISEL